jgi:hypothetical protein
VTAWRLDPAEQRELVTPAAYRLVDDYTGDSPLAPLRTFLEVSDGAGGWRKTDIAASRGDNGVLAFPDLEKRAEVVNLPARRYRFHVEPSALYRAHYRATLDGLEFDAFPYNDAVLPPAYATQVTSLPLVPAAGYPFPGNVPVLRGTIERLADQSRVVDAEVSTGTERVLSDERGEFALPLRSVTPNVPFSVDVVHHRSGELAVAVFVIPIALGVSHTIAIS